MWINYQEKNFVMEPYVKTLQFYQCPTCLDDIKNIRNPKKKKNAYFIPCTHVYCLECIKKWLLDFNGISCPMCKVKIESTSDYDINKAFPQFKVK